MAKIIPKIDEPSVCRHPLKPLLISALLLAGSCSTSSSWSLYTIGAGDPLFDSSRLVYVSKQAHPTLSFEIMRLQDEPQGFINSTRFRFTEQDQLKVFFRIGGKLIEDQVTLHEGNMRVRLSAEITERIIQALQDGDEVGILIDGFEETLDPSQFSSSFAQFLKKSF